MERDIPIGLGMALAQNMRALDKFAQLSPAERERCITRAAAVKSKREMKQFAEAIAQGHNF